MRVSNVTAKWLALALTLAAFLLRAYRLAAQSYWIDEAWTLFYAHQSLGELWHSLQTIRAAPPLYHLLTIYWVQGVGDGEYALRFLSLVFSVLAVPLAYRLGKTLAGARLGLLLALLLALAPYQVWHGQDARNYSLLTAAATASMWSFLNLWRRGRWGGWRWTLLYLLSTEIAVLTHYHGLVIIGVQGLFFLLTWRRHRPYYLPWAGLLLLILVPLGSWLIFGSQLWQSTHWLPLVGLGDSYLRSAVAYSVGELVPSPTGLWLTAPFGLLYGLGLLYAARRPWPRLGWRGPEMLAFLVSYTLAPNLAVWIYSQLQTSVYLERYLIPVQVGYLFTVGLGIMAVAEGVRWLGWRGFQRSPGVAKLGMGLVAVFVLLGMVGVDGWVLQQYYSNNVYAKPNWRGVIQMIEQFSLPGDAILLTGDGGEMLFDYYYRGDLPVYYDFNTPVPPPDQARQTLAQLTDRHQRLWFTPYGVEIDRLLESWLAEHSYPAWHQWLGRKRLALYDTEAALSTVETPDAAFSAGGATLRLLTVERPAAPAAAGDTLPLRLTWQAETPLPHDYRLSLRLINPAGDLFAQNDWPPLPAPTTWTPQQPITDQRSLWLPPDLPPGDYLLQLVVYQPTSGQPVGQPVTLSPVQVQAAELVVPPEALPLPNFTARPVGPLTLVGYAHPARLQPGQEIWLWLYWQRPPANGGSPLSPAAQLQISLAGKSETSRASFKLSDALGPLDSWRPGQVRRAVYHLPTSPRLDGNQAMLKVGFALFEESEDVVVGNINLTTRNRQFKAPAAAQPLAAEFEQKIALLGYDLQADQPLSPGAALPLTLYWQAEAEMEGDYTVFVQLLDPAGQVAAQIDQPPLAGAAPTTTWLPGEILTDPYALTLPPDLPPGPYRLITGLYRPDTGQRLTLPSGADFVELATVQVE